MPTDLIPSTQTERSLPVASLRCRMGWVLGCLSLLGSFAPGQTSYSPVVGFVRVTLNGTSSGSGDNFVAPALLEEEAYRGALVAGVPAANQLKAVGVAWTTNQFHTNASANSHFVEIVASSNANAVGLFTDIVSHTADTLTTASNLSSQLSGGETIVIRAHKTLAKIFGTTNESGLGQGAAGAADTISVMTPGVSPVFNSYYYRSGQVLGGTGWRSTANPLSDQADRPLKIGDGLLIQRKQSAATELMIKGYVHEGPLRIPLKKGYNLIDPLAPITDQTTATPVAGPAFTLGGTASSSRRPSGLDAVLANGTATTADLLNIRTGSSFTSYYRRAPGQPIGGTGWRVTTNPINNVEGTVLPAAAAYLFQIYSAGGTWVRPQPFDIP